MSHKDNLRRVSWNTHEVTGEVGRPCDTSDKRAAGRKSDAEADVALNHSNLPRPDTKPTKFSGQVQRTLLRNKKKIAVSIVESPVYHTAIGEVLVNGDS
jgi:hypothetical protein